MNSLWFEKIIIICMLKFPVMKNSCWMVAALKGKEEHFFKRLRSIGNRVMEEEVGSYGTEYK